MSTQALRDGTPLLVDAGILDRLKRLADGAGRTVAELVADALRDYVDESEQRIADIRAGIEQADAGELVPWEEVNAGIEQRLAALQPAE